MNRSVFHAVLGLILLSSFGRNAHASAGSEIDYAFDGCNRGDWDQYVQYRDKAFAEDASIKKSSEVRDGYKIDQTIAECDAAMIKGKDKEQKKAAAALGYEGSKDAHFMLMDCNLPTSPDWKARKAEFFKKFPGSESKVIDSTDSTVGEAIASCEQDAQGRVQSAEDGKTHLYFSKKKITAAPSGASPTFGAGDPIYAWAQFPSPSSIGRNYYMPFGVTNSKGKDVFGNAFEVGGAQAQEGPIGKGNNPIGFGFWIVPSPDKVAEANLPKKFLTSFSAQSPDVYTVSWDDQYRTGSFKYDNRAGKAKILAQLSKLENAGDQQYLADADKEAEKAQMLPAKLKGSREERQLTALVKSSSDFSGKQLKAIRFVDTWSATQRDNNFVMARFADAQVAVFDPANKRCWLWYLQIRQDPGGLSINRSSNGGLKCDRIK